MVGKSGEHTMDLETPMTESDKIGYEAELGPEHARMRLACGHVRGW